MQEGWGTCSIHTASVGRGEHTGAAVQPQEQTVQCDSVSFCLEHTIHGALQPFSKQTQLAALSHLGMAAEINEQEKAGVLSPACCV